jgi:hypothetical protein
MKKWASENNTAFSKEEVQMFFFKNEEMQTKTTLRFHLTSFRWLPSRTQTTTNVGKNVGEKEPLCTVGRNVN